MISSAVTASPPCCEAGPCSGADAGTGRDGARPRLPPRPSRWLHIARSATASSERRAAAAARRSALPRASSARRRYAAGPPPCRRRLRHSDNRAMGRGAAGVRVGAADRLSSPAHPTTRPGRCARDPFPIRKSSASPDAFLLTTPDPSVATGAHESPPLWPDPVARFATVPPQTSRKDVYGWRFR